MQSVLETPELIECIFTRDTRTMGRASRVSKTFHESLKAKLRDLRPKYVGDIDPRKVHLVRDGADIFKDAAQNRLKLQLCPNEEDPLIIHHCLGDPSTRSKIHIQCFLTNTTTVSALKALDKYMVAYAAANSKDLFGRVLTEKEVREWYCPSVRDLDDGSHMISFRVKCQRAPTKIFRVTAPGTAVRVNAEALTKRKARIVPRVTVFSSWGLDCSIFFGLHFVADSILVLG